jgi:hypothetical protein
MAGWYFRPYRSRYANREPSTQGDAEMTVAAFSSNVRWSHAPGLVALAVVAFIVGVTLGIAGF